MARIDHRDRVADMTPTAIERVFARARTRARQTLHVEPWQQRTTYPVELEARTPLDAELVTVAETHKARRVLTGSRQRWAKGIA